MLFYTCLHYQAADACNFSAIAYEFVKEGLLIYECEISESKSQVRALTAIVGTLLNCRNFPTEDYEALITKTAQVHGVLSFIIQCQFSLFLVV